VHTALRYLWHWLTAVNEHSLHSPFLFNLYTKTIKRKAVLEDFNSIEQARQQLINSDEKISVTRLGADSRVNNESVRPVSAIAKQGITSARVSKLLFNMITDFESKNIIELGTSFGINTMYMAKNPHVKVTTFEGCPNTAAIAQKNFDKLGYSNIEIVIENIDETLPQFIHQSTNKVDLVFMDANHQLTPTLNYFDQLLKISHSQTIIVLDDIYWSAEMTQAWEELKEHPQVTASVDLFALGILFFKPELEKVHFRLTF
jgi:predicted O-methyltransferase YrrM